jgi:hypothetical protein
MAKQRDGWLRRETGGYVGRWVAKQEDGWLTREMGGSVEKWVAQ